MIGRLANRDLVLAAAFLLLFDVAQSFFWTCYYIQDYQPDAGINDQQGCGPFGGPIIFALRWFFGRDANPIVAAFTVVLAISTIALWFATNKAADAAKKAAEHIPTVERAYVKLSHHPPGVQFDGASWSIQIAVTNYGNTPAQITDAHAIGHYINPGDPLPDEPDYRRQRGRPNPVHTFLAANDSFNFSIGPTNECTESMLRDIRERRLNFYVVGYVDYIDKFGTRHRAGYARRYIPALDDRSAYASDEQFATRNNLPFITRRDYNYDRSRLRGEGNDWDQQT